MQKNPAPACDAWISRVRPDRVLSAKTSLSDAASGPGPCTGGGRCTLRIANAERLPAASHHNWALRASGRYQRDYLSGLPPREWALRLPRDVLCLHIAIDQRGEPLSGANRYVIHFGGDPAGRSGRSLYMTRGSILCRTAFTATS
jgi:hypothetical protein